MGPTVDKGLGPSFLSLGLLRQGLFETDFDILSCEDILSIL